MIIVALIAAVFIYVGLFLSWATISAHLTQPISWMALLSEMLSSRQPPILFILRGLIIIIFFYVIADFLFSSTRQGVKNAKKKKAAANANAVEAARQRPPS